jgi:hypothetical protein
MFLGFEGLIRQFFSQLCEFDYTLIKGLALGKRLAKYMQRVNKMVQVTFNRFPANQHNHPTNQWSGSYDSTQYERVTTNRKGSQGRKG